MRANAPVCMQKEDDKPGGQQDQGMPARHMAGAAVGICAH
jgi:hypothetical protein